MEGQLRVFFVETDSTLTTHLSKLALEDFLVEIFDHPNACLQRMSDVVPEILVLDLPDDDQEAINFCKEVKDDFMLNSAHVLIISPNSDIETQLACYDAGAEDVLERPVETEKLQRKLQIMGRFLKEKHSLSHQAGFATQTAMSAMSSMGELGLVLQFMGRSLVCNSPETLASEILNTVRQYDLASAIQFRLPEGDITFGEDGINVPLEMSVLNHARSAGRIFQFKTHCVFNFGLMTLLIKNMPLEDQEKCGRIRDNLAHLAEGAAERLRTLCLEREVEEKRNSLSNTLSEVENALDTVYANYRRSTLDLTQTMLEYQEALGRSFVHLQLTGEQESQLTTTASTYMKKMVNKQDESLFIIGQLEKLAQKLKSAINGRSDTA